MTTEIERRIQAYQSALHQHLKTCQANRKQIPAKERDTALCCVYDSHKSLMGDKNKPGDLVQGTLDMLVLKALERGPKHGYGVAEWIQEKSEDVLRVEEGALYPALHRLELRRLLKSEWGTSDNNRRAKYYSLTALGRKQLGVENEHWGRMTAAIAKVMQTA